MKHVLLTLFMIVFPPALFAQASAQKPAIPAHPNTPASQEVETEKVVAPHQAPPSSSAQVPNTGLMDAAQVKALLHKVWLAQYRLNDLLAQVHPENWKMPVAVRQSFEQSLDSLHKSIGAEEEWRGQYDGRPDSLYLGFQTYLAISAVLPRVEGVARIVSQYENPSFGTQYAQVANKLFDLQQLMEPHLVFLLKNQDGFMLVAQTNLSSCQNELNFAEHNKEGIAAPMKNIAPVFKGRGRPAHDAAPPAANGKAAKSEGTTDKSNAAPSRKTGKK